MNPIMLESLKNKIIEMIDNGDIKSLKEFINSKNLIDDKEIIKAIFYKYNFRLDNFLSLFDDDGNFISNKYSLKKFIENHQLFIYAFKVDPNFFDTLPEKERKFIQFCIDEIKQRRDYDIAVILSYSGIKSSENIDLFFDGNGWTDFTYKGLFRTSNIININTLSEKLKSHYTPYELKIMKALYDISDNGKEEDQERTEIVRELLFYLDSKEIEKYTLVRRSIFKKIVSFSKNDELYKKILFGSRIKELLYGEKFEKITDAEKEKISATLGELGTKYFFLNNGYLDNVLWSYGYRYEDLDKAIYIKNDHIYLKPEVMSRIINKEDKRTILHILGRFYEKERLNELNIEDKNDNIESLYIVSKTIIELYKYNKVAPVRFILSNIEENKRLLYLPPEKLTNFKDLILEITKRIEESNAIEFKMQSNDIIYYILFNENEDYIGTLDKIERIFNNDYLPTLAKKYLLFKILNPDLENRDYSNDKIVSPTLKNINPERRHALLFGDILRITLGTNNVNFKHYLEKLYYGNTLYLKVANGELNIDSLPENEIETLKYFLAQLTSLYNNTKEGKEKSFIMTDNIKEDLNRLVPLFKPTEDFTLLDRIVRMYGLHVGLGTFNDILTTMNDNVRKANERGRRLAQNNLVLEKGDLVKGIIDLSYLYDILQNGSLCREFLGAYSGTDTTSLDTDLSMILKKKINNIETMKDTIANDFGPVWFVIKKGKYPITREQAQVDSDKIERGPECFTTIEEGHMGIRTGFPTTDIDYIMIDEKEVNPKTVGFIVALNGIYIPVVNKSGKVLLTPEEYDEIQSKMDGLSYYGHDEFSVSSNLRVPIDYDNQEIIEDSKEKRKNINEFIKNIMSEKFGYTFIPKLSQDIRIGNVQLIDTGSTGRGTNVGKKTDFDFIMRVDEKANRHDITVAICESLGVNYDEAVEKGMIIGNDNIRLKQVMVPGIPTPVDLDITYQSKADNLTYTTDMAIADRLESIRRYHPDKYEDVLDNIIYAKHFLKEAGAYKPSHSRENEGGLGGVGIENWVLQNGGSFYDASVSFIAAATDTQGKMIPYKEFKEKYKVYDFGENFYNGKHDEFVSDNMTPEGYERMYKALLTYVKRNENRILIQEKEEGPRFNR